MSVEMTGQAPFGNLALQMSRMMDQLQRGFFSFCPSETWTPSVNVYENDAGYLVCVDLAGVDKEKIDVQLADNRLKLSGRRPVPLHPDWPDSVSEADARARAERLRVHLMEIDHGAFCREVELPLDVDQGRIAARHVNGMLWIELPKAPPTSPSEAPGAAKAPGPQGAK